MRKLILTLGLMGLLALQPDALLSQAFAADQATSKQADAPVVPTLEPLSSEKAAPGSAPLGGPLPAFYDGALTLDSLTFNNPGGAGAGNQHYCVQEFTVDAAGAYTIEMASPNTTGTPSDALDTFLRLHATSFDPGAPAGAIASNDDFSGTLTVLPGPYAGTITSLATGFQGDQPSSRLLNVNLTNGTPYFLVHTAWPSSGNTQGGTSGQPIGAFYTAIAGPGAIALGASDCAGASVGEARVQVAHLAPFASGVDSEVTIRLNGDDALTNVAYGDSTAYITLPAIEYLIEVVLSDDTVATSATVELMADTDYTVVAIGDGVNQGVSLLALVDDNAAPAAGNFKLRLGHAAPFAGGLASAEVRLADNTLIAEVDFGDVTGYSEFAAGNYDLRITAPGGDPVLIDIAPADFNDGDILTAFAAGDGNFQPLGAFALPSDAVGFFLPLVIPPEIEVTPASFSFTVVAGGVDADALSIANVGGGTLTWDIDLEDATSALRGIGYDPALDEVLDITDFQVISPANGGEPVVQTIPAGVLTSGRVVGFSFEGTASNLTGNGDWASDMCMQIQGPDGSSYSVGGISTIANCNINPWDFQGGGSSADGTYSSEHVNVWPFPPGAEGDGDWTFTFIHGWNAGAANPMDWSDVTVTLHKVTIPEPCDNPGAVSWLSVNPAAGTTQSGSPSLVDVIIDSDGLAAGTYNANLCVNSDDSLGNTLVVVPVELTVADPAAAEITVMPNDISGTAEVGDSTTATLTIGNIGNATLDWDIQEAPSVSRRAHFPSTPWQSAAGNRSGSLAAEILDPSWSAKRQLGKPAVDPMSKGGPAVPAYTNTGFSRTDYALMDAEVPGMLMTIVDPQTTTIFAGTFIGNDLDNQFFIATGGGALPQGAYGFIDTTTGAVNQLGVLTGVPAPGTWTSAAWDPVSGTLYAVIVPAGGNNQLFEIDVDTGTGTLVGTVNGIAAGGIVVAIAIDSNGLMYGLDIIDDVLVAIDKTDATGAVIGPVGVDANFAQDMDFDRSTDTLYWASYLGGGNSNIRIIDTSTGASTVVGPIQDGAELLSFSIAASVNLCDNPADVPWLSVDQVSGSIVEGGPAVEVEVTLDASALGAGTHTAALCVTSNDPQNPSVTVPVSFEVTQVAQTIDFAALDDRTIGESPFTVVATASSGLSVSFASLTASVCSVTGDDVSLLAVGTCSIEATQAGDATFLPAAPVVRSFEVLAADVVVSPGSLPRGIIDVPYSVTFTASGAGTTTPFSYSVTGTLPAGMTLAASGELTGTPTEIGLFEFTVTATDDTDPGVGGPFSGSRAYSLIIDEEIIFFDGFEGLLLPLTLGTDDKASYLATQLLAGLLAAGPAAGQAVLVGEMMLKDQRGMGNPKRTL